MKAVLVGCGNMGFAMLNGWLEAGILAAQDVTVIEPTPALRQRAADRGVHAFDSIAGVPVEAADLIVLAVKPQVMRSILPDYVRFAHHAGFLSVAAGIPIATFEEILGQQAAIIRCMPNTPAAIGKGMMVSCFNGKVTGAQKTFVNALLAASGAVAEVEDEDMMDAVTAVSGSGPAYVFHFIEALTNAAISAGLPDDLAKLLAMQTVYGAACLAKDSADAPGTLREQVTSPNGTTAAALDVLMGDNRLTALVTEAVEAAKARSIELGR